MCIRDSGYTKEEMKMCYETRKIFGCPDIELCATTVRVPVAVSYTHLRAHETVLDLVCRLLPEKKKNKKKKK